MDESTTTESNQRLEAAVECPHCERAVTVPVSNKDTDPTPSPYVVAFGEHRSVRCPVDHEFWVYYC